MKSEDDMSHNSATGKSSISKGRTPEEIAEFWDAHSLANHWNQTHEVEFEIRAQRIDRSIPRYDSSGGINR